MTEPLVSVLVPLYNHEKYIETCLASIAGEAYRNLELVVLDDGSRDRSFALVQDWIAANGGRFARVKTWTQPNAGICRTLNRLVAEAEGAYVVLVASDDALLPGGIQARVAYLEAHPETLAVFGDAEAIDDRGGRLAASTIKQIHHGSRAALQDPRRITRELLLRWSIPGPVFLARRSTWDPVAGVGPYDETLKVEDRDYYLRLLARGALAFVDYPVAQYRLHGLNVSRNPAGDPDLNSLQHQIASDVQKSAAINLHRFQGLDRALLRLVTRNDQYRKPRKPVRYNLTRNLIKLFKNLNRMGLLGGRQDRKHG